MHYTVTYRWANEPKVIWEQNNPEHYMFAHYLEYPRKRFRTLRTEITENINSLHKTQTFTHNISIVFSSIVAPASNVFLPT